MKTKIAKQTKNDNLNYTISFDVSEPKIGSENNLDKSLFYLINAIIYSQKEDNFSNNILTLNRVQETIRILKDCETELQMKAFKE